MSKKVFLLLILNIIYLIESEELREGLIQERSEEVTHQLTAAHFGIGSLEVYGTPYMNALIENTANDLLKPYYKEGEISVGTKIDVDHLSATPVGTTVKCQVVLTKIEKLKLTFEAECYDEKGLIGKGYHERLLINQEKFVKKALTKIEEKKEHILIIKTGSAIESLVKNPNIGDYSDMIQRVIPLSFPPNQNLQFSFQVIDVQVVPEQLPTDLSKYTSIIIHGSPHMVSDRLPWSEKTADWIKQVVIPSNKPILGICYGHQLICQALGGEVGYNPLGTELGTVEMTFTEEAKNDALFSNYAGQTFPVCVTHSQSIIVPPKTEDFYVIGNSECEQYEAVHFTGNAWGFQFHPEFTHQAIKEIEAFDAEHPDLAVNYEKNSYKYIDILFNRSLIKSFIQYSIQLKRENEGSNLNKMQVKE